MLYIARSKKVPCAFGRQTFVKPQPIIRSSKPTETQMNRRIARCRAELSSDPSTMIAELRTTRKPLIWISRTWLKSLNTEEMVVVCEGLDELGYVQWNDHADADDILMGTEDAINEMMKKTDEFFG